MTLTKPNFSPRLLAIIIALLMLMLCMGVFNSRAFAQATEDSKLIVNAAWLDGDADGLPPTIRVDVTDPDTGTRSAIAVPLSAYLQEGENTQFITIQAVDLYGRQSGVIEIRNPFYVPAMPQIEISDNAVRFLQVEHPSQIQSQSFTPCNAIFNMTC